MVTRHAKERRGETLRVPVTGAERGARGKAGASRLSVAKLARLLSGVGNGRVTVKMIRADLNAGAPVAPDGTVSLVHYAAWLARESKR